MRSRDTELSKEAYVRRRRSQLRLACVVLLSALAGCTLQAPYMHGWDLAEGIDNRWTGGTFEAKKFSPDETAVYQELGTPDAIRFFRTLATRQKVYEWIYLKRDQTVWFEAGKRVDYVAVDTDSSIWTKQQRETLQNKFTAGGAVGAVVGGVAAGSLLVGNKLGIR